MTLVTKKYMFLLKYSWFTITVYLRLASVCTFFFVLLNEIQECNKREKTAFRATLNVSIRAHASALWKGCEPEQPMHVYLAALPAQCEWLSFSHLVWPMKKYQILKLQCLNSVSRRMCEVVGVRGQTEQAIR